MFAQFTGRKSRHIAEVLASPIDPGHVYQPREDEAGSADVAPVSVAQAHAEQVEKEAAQENLAR